MLRICSICDKEKEESDFYKRDNERLRNECKECVKQRVRKYNKTHPPKPSIRLVCSICRKEFYVFPNRLKKGAKYCSSRCGALANSKKRRLFVRSMDIGGRTIYVKEDGSMYARQKNGSILFGEISKCKNCNKEYFLANTHKKHGKCIYCSNSCADEAWSKRNLDILHKELQVTKSILIGNQLVYLGQNGKAFIVLKYKRGKQVRERKFYGQIKKCPGCNNDFFAQSRYEASNKQGGKYCSKDCFMKFGFSGSKHARWKGGTRNRTGYVQIHSPGHPRADKQGYVFQHHIAAEKQIGRNLKKHEVVHHIDGGRANNSIENLIVFNDFQHKSFHNRFSELAYEFINEKSPHLVGKYLEFLKRIGNELREKDGIR